MTDNKKYVAVVVRRVYTKDGNFIYVASHPELGYLDEETKIFKDRNGNEYLSLLDKTLMMSEVTDAYYGAIEMSKIREATGDDSLREAISNYTHGSQRYIYYVSTLGDGIPFVIPIELEQLKEELYDAFCGSVSEDDDSQDKADETKEYLEGEYKSAHAMDDDIDCNLTDEEIREELNNNIKNILTKMLKGEYSLEELRTISELFREEKDDIDSLLESIDIQLEATENGESKNSVKSSGIGKKVINLPSNYVNIEKLYNNVTKTLIAQDEPLRRVITEIVRKEQDPHGKKRGLLITGESGVGKTLMMSLIAKYLNKPFMKIDSTQLTIPGYVGKDIQEFLWDLYIQCGKDKDKTEHAIVFFDEIDKKGSSKKDDVSGKGVLNVLLPFIEGSIYDATEDTKKQGEAIKIDSSKMTVIFGGAFTDVYKNMSKKDNVIGFDKNIDENGQEVPVSTNDFIEKAKMPDEFMGRVSVIKLNDFDLEDIKRVLLESDESAIKIQQKLFKQLGVKLTAGDDFIDAVAKQAIERKTGARGLNTVIDEATWVAYADAYSNLGKYQEIVLEEDTVNNPKQYQKVYRKREV